MRVSKYFVFMVVAVAISSSVKGQSQRFEFEWTTTNVPSEALEKDYRNFTLNSKTVASLNNAFASGKLISFDPLGGYDRYFSNVWVTGGARNGSNVLIKDKIKFNFDFKEHELYAQWKDTALVLDNANLRSFYLYQKGVPHYFTKMPAIDTKHYFEVVGNMNTLEVPDGKVKLLKLRTVQIKKTDKDGLTSSFTGADDEITSDIYYYISLPDNTFTKVKLNKKAFKTALAKYADKSEKFFSGDEGPFDEEKAVALLEYINQ